MSPELLERISERAGNVCSRTYTSGIEADAEPVDFGSLADDLRTHGAPGAQGLLGIVGRLGGMLGGIGGVTAMGPGGPVRFGGKATPKELPPPPSAAELQAASAAIGRTLPEDLVALYGISDGGFGPGAGLSSLNQLVEKYRDLTSEPFGPLGQPWPPALLPLFDEDPAWLCLDLDTGAMVLWDPEEIEDEESEEDWQRSFRADSHSLSEAMEQWLGRPTMNEDTERAIETARRSVERATKSPVTGWPITISDRAAYVEGEITALGYSDEIRRDCGLPEVGWEDEVRRRHGLL